MSDKYSSVSEHDYHYFEIQWVNLSYTVYNSKSTRALRKLQGFRNIPKSKKILENVSGQVNSGEMMAFMGPSGAGKSTLMECIVGRRINGRTGDVFICGNNLDNIKVAFIAQKNTFLTALTVRETIYFATRLLISSKNENSIVEPLLDENGDIIQSKSFNDYCRIVTDRIISELGLEVCQDNRVNNCSGGQLKRLAIAQELVGRPRILILDEPTSGLDSASTLQVIQMLRALCESQLKVTVFASIHQPSYKVLNLFHKLYVLSLNGNPIYADTPHNLLNYFKLNGIECSSVNNPADVLIEVASGDHGTVLMDSMIQSYRKSIESSFKSKYTCKAFTDMNDFHTFPDFKHMLILSIRNTLITIRDPVAFGVRCLATIIVPLFLSTLYGSKVGIRGGCPPKFDADFEPPQLGFIGDEIKAEVKTTYINLGNLFFIIVFAMFNSLMTTLLCFPGEMIVFKNEKHNYWYSDFAFFFGKTLSEIPHHFIFSIVLWSLQHILQNQIFELWRLASINLIIILISFISQTFGYIIGALFMNNTKVSVFVGPSFVCLFCVLLCGALIKIKNLPLIFYALSYLDFVRFALEGAIISLYGFSRCPDKSNDLKDGRDAFVVWMSAMLGVYGDGSDSSTDNSLPNNNYSVGMDSPSEKFVEEMVDTISGDFISESNEVRSLVMNLMELEDWYLYRNIIVLLAYLVMVRIISYFTISARVKLNH